MTSLPDFETVAAFDSWLQRQSEKPHKSVYAVVHREHGFIGVSALHRHKHSGFFYFWIGTDYQTLGYGQRAAKLLFEMARQTVGIESVFTCAFKDNSRSCSALGQLGFKRLPISAVAPDNDYNFYLKQRNSVSDCESYKALSKLLNGIDSPIRLNDFKQVKERA